MKRTFILMIFFATIISFSYSQDTREVKKTVEIANDGTVFIDTYKGSITIETWDKPQVDILARIEPDGSGRYTKENVERTQIDIDSSPREVRIKSDYDRLKKNRSWFFGWFNDENTTLPFVHYTISMPKFAHLRIKDYKSESYISNLHSSIDLDTYKGTVSITGFEGSINLETYKGKVGIDWLKLAKDSHFETYKGDIKISLSRDAAFDLESDFGRRVDFYSDFDAVYHSKRHSSNEAQGIVHGGGSKLRLSSEKGTIHLRAR